VPEKLAFQQCLIQSGAVELNIGAFAPLSQIVNGMGDQLFAGSRLTLNDHGRVALGGFLDHFENYPHPARPPDHPLKIGICRR